MPKTRSSRVVLLLAALLVVLVCSAAPASAQEAPVAPTVPGAPAPPGDPGAPADPTSSGSDATININLPDTAGKPSQSVLIILILTVLSVAPALLIMMTSFTRIAIVLSLTRNALGLQGIPPNQVIVGLSLFLSLFVMGPTLSKINNEALQPMLHDEIDQGTAYNNAVGPIREFMLKQTRKGELQLFVSETTEEKPATSDDVPLNALIPAFILSELKTAFIIGFIIFIPFLVIDIIVSSSLMSMGMMMLPPSLVSLPFKLLLFVMVDGWALVVRSLLQSFNT